MAQEPTRGAAKRPHPSVPELVRGVDLSSKALRARGLTALAEVLTNGEYWLSFELSRFEPLLACAPSPLRELGVGVVLRFGEGVDGRLEARDLERARELLLPGLPSDLAGAIEAALGTLGRALSARERLEAHEREGFARYTASSALSVHGLRAGGRAQIIAGDRFLARDAELALGEVHALSAADERGRALSAPEVESETGAPIWARAPEKETRAVLLVVPGRYRLRVPGRAEAQLSILAR